MINFAASKPSKTFYHSKLILRDTALPFQAVQWNVHDVEKEPSFRELYMTELIHSP